VLSNIDQIPLNSWVLKYFLQSLYFKTQLLTHILTEGHIINKNLKDEKSNKDFSMIEDLIDLSILW